MKAEPVATADAVTEEPPTESAPPSLAPKGPRAIPGAPPGLAQKQAEKLLSKSSLKRLKRKQNTSGGDQAKLSTSEDDYVEPPQKPPTTNGQTNGASTATSQIQSVVPAVKAPPASPPKAPAPAVETFTMDMLIPGFDPPGDSLLKVNGSLLASPALYTAPIVSDTKPLPVVLPVVAPPTQNPISSIRPADPTPTPAPASTGDSSKKYYKSSGGFSVRL